MSYIVYAKRSAMGKLGGALASVRVDDMLASLLIDLKKHITFDPSEIDDIIIGCANQAGEDNRNLARMSSLLAGFPFDVPAATVNRLCGSSLEALFDAHAKITAGLCDCMVVGGAESMSRAPYVLSKPESAYDRSQKMYDSTFGWRFENEKMKNLFPLLGMGQTAEEVQMKHQISRAEQDQFALLSHQKAAQAYHQNHFKEEILPITISAKKSSVIFERDECVREDSSLEKLSKLPAVFKKDGTVTAGNSSPMNDGASLVLLVSESFLKRHKLRPIVKVTGAAARGIHPSIMGLGPVEAIRRLCQKTQIKLEKFDVIELNEAFAVQALGCIKELQLDKKIINIHGGAIALGHPLGCSGTRITTTLAHIMKRNPHHKLGLAAMCIGVGQGIAVSFENCN